MIRYLRIAGLLVFASMLCLGCGQKRPEGMPDTYPVTITVKVNGVPLEGVEVGAYPLEKNQTQWFGSGLFTDDKGQVKMKSSELDGLIAGEFTLTVKKNILTSDNSGDLYECFIDTSYWRPVTSPLKIKVEPGGKNAFEFDVKKFDPRTFNEANWAMRIKK